jgi:hypothetical protein
MVPFPGAYIPAAESDERLFLGRRYRARNAAFVRSANWFIANVYVSVPEEAAALCLVTILKLAFHAASATASSVWEK